MSLMDSFPICAKLCTMTLGTISRTSNHSLCWHTASQAHVRTTAPPVDNIRHFLTGPNTSIPAQTGISSTGYHIDDILNSKQPYPLLKCKPRGGSALLPLPYLDIYLCGYPPARASILGLKGLQVLQRKTRPIMPPRKEPTSTAPAKRGRSNTETSDVAPSSTAKRTKTVAPAAPSSTPSHDVDSDSSAELAPANQVAPSNKGKDKDEQWEGTPEEVLGMSPD
jgi:hypothetical protein